MFDHLLESSHRDDSNKWPNIGLGEEITQVVSMEGCLYFLLGDMCNSAENSQFYDGKRISVAQCNTTVIVSYVTFSYHSVAEPTTLTQQTSAVLP